VKIRESKFKLFYYIKFVIITNDFLFVRHYRVNYARLMGTNPEEEEEEEEEQQEEKEDGKKEQVQKSLASKKVSVLSADSDFENVVVDTDMTSAYIKKKGIFKCIM
jgi:molecular chaperone GrpE (heat shock protein)